MSFNIRFQRPDSEDLTFLELLAGEALHADYGGAIFAFAT